MSKWDELRRRVGAILETEYPREWVAEDVTGQQYSEWYREKADAVLAEIERAHVIVDRAWFEQQQKALRAQGMSGLVWQASLAVPDGELWAVGNNGEVLGKITGIQVE